MPRSHLAKSRPRRRAPLATASPQAREEVLLHACSISTDRPGYAARIRGLSILLLSTPLRRRSSPGPPTNPIPPTTHSSRHDEVRRYAARHPHPPHRNRSPPHFRGADVPRWGLSLPQLSPAKAHLLDPISADPNRPSKALVADFQRYRQRAWRPGGQTFLSKQSLEDTGRLPVHQDRSRHRKCPVYSCSTSFALCSKGFSFDGFIHPVLGAPVVRYLIDQDEPWKHFHARVSKFSRTGSRALVLADAPAGDDLREELPKRGLLKILGTIPAPGSIRRRPPRLGD